MSARARIHAMFRLDEAATAELDLRLDALVVEALLAAGVQYVDCLVCGAAQPVDGECGTCTFKARMAAELAARGMVAAPAETATPDFFQVGHTYTEPHGITDWLFRVDHITTHPEDGERTAIGWRRFRGEWEVYAYGEDDFEIHQHVGYIDATEAGAR
jgi:hypothetical protein